MIDGTAKGGCTVGIMFVAVGVDDEGAGWPAEATRRCRQYVDSVFTELLTFQKISRRGAGRWSLLAPVYRVEIVMANTTEAAGLCEALHARGWSAALQLTSEGRVPGCSRVACRKGRFDIPTSTSSMKTSRMSGTGGFLEDGR